MAIQYKTLCMDFGVASLQIIVQSVRISESVPEELISRAVYRMFPKNTQTIAMLPLVRVSRFRFLCLCSFFFLPFLFLFFLFSLLPFVLFCD